MTKNIKQNQRFQQVLVLLFVGVATRVLYVILILPDLVLVHHLRFPTLALVRESGCSYVW